MISKKGVIQLVDSLEIGGAEVLAVNITNGLSKYLTDSHICATRAEGYLKNSILNPTNYLFLNRKKTIDFKSFIRFKKYLKDNKINIIHAHGTSSFFAFCIKLMYPKIKIIWHNHYGNNVNLTGVNLLALKIQSYFFSCIIHVNEDLKKWSQKKLYCRENYYLKNFPIFSNLNKETNLQGLNGKRITHIAGFRAEKDHETLLRAFSLFIVNNKNWSLHLIGKLHKGAYSDKILNLINTLNLKDKVFTYNSCFDIKNILEQTDIAVLTSKSEGLPISLLEYGLSKTAVIVTNVGECSNVIQNEYSGYVVEKENPKLLSEKLDLLANSKSKRIIFAERNFKNISDNYSQSLFLKRLLEVYKS